MRAVPLTSLHGRELNPAFSPDGTRFAFSWDGEDASNFDIYVQVVGAGGRVPIAKHPAQDLDPRWSPDGRYLAFARRISPGRVALLKNSALGGGETKMVEAADPSGPAIGSNHFLAWSHSGDAIIFSDRQDEGGPFALYLYRLESGERLPLTNVPDSYYGDMSPSLSDDGKTLVFVRYSSLTEGAIYVLEMDSRGIPEGRARQVVSHPLYTHAPVFRPNSREIVFSMWDPEPRLWRVDVSGRIPASRIAEIGRRGTSPNFSPDGKRLAYSRWMWEHNIWRLELSGPGIAAGPPRKWVYSTEDEEHSDYSPNGAKIAFMSNRSGDHQIWVCDADGSKPEQLTSLDGVMSGTPRWSPGGGKIAFDSNASGRVDIYVINANGGELTRLTSGPVQGHSPRYSQDGKWIYFVGGVGKPSVWRIPADGGEAEEIVEDSLGRPFLSPDGRYVYHVRSDMRLRRVPTDGGEEEVVLGAIRSNSSFAVVSEGIYYTPEAPILGEADIQFYRFDDRSVTTVWHSPNGTPDRFAISRDGRYLLFTLPQNVGNDLMLVEDFR